MKITVIFGQFARSLTCTASVAVISIPVSVPCIPMGASEARYAAEVRMKWPRKVPRVIRLVRVGRRALRRG